MPENFNKIEFKYVKKLFINCDVDLYHYNKVNSV
jgi:hypothetical protein